MKNQDRTNSQKHTQLPAVKDAGQKLALCPERDLRHCSELLGRGWDHKAKDRQEPKAQPSLPNHGLVTRPPQQILNTGEAAQGGKGNMTLVLEPKKKVQVQSILKKELVRLGSSVNMDTRGTY